MYDQLQIFVLLSCTWRYICYLHAVTSPLSRQAHGSIWEYLGVSKLVEGLCLYTYTASSLQERQETDPSLAPHSSGGGGLYSSLSQSGFVTLASVSCIIVSWKTDMPWIASAFTWWCRESFMADMTIYIRQTIFIKTSIIKMTCVSY